MPTQHGGGQGSPAAQGALVVGVLVGNPWSGWKRTQLSQTAAVTPSVPGLQPGSPQLGETAIHRHFCPRGLRAWPEGGMGLLGPLGGRE